MVVVVVVSRVESARQHRQSLNSSKQGTLTSLYLSASHSSGSGVHARLRASCCTRHCAWSPPPMPPPDTLRPLSLVHSTLCQTLVHVFLSLLINLSHRGSTCHACHHSALCNPHRRGARSSLLPASHHSYVFHRLSGSLLPSIYNLHGYTPPVGTNSPCSVSLPSFAAPLFSAPHSPSHVSMHPYGT